MKGFGALTRDSCVLLPACVCMCTLTAAEKHLTVSVRLQGSDSTVCGMGVSVTPTRDELCAAVGGFVLLCCYLHCCIGFASARMPPPLQPSVALACMVLDSTVWPLWLLWPPAYENCPELVWALIKECSQVFAQLAAAWLPVGAPPPLQDSAAV